MTYHPPTPETPADWHHVRIQPIVRGKFSLRTWYLNHPFTETDKEAMRIAGRSTERLTLIEARALGQVIEDWMTSQEPGRGRKPRQ